MGKKGMKMEGAVLVGEGKTAKVDMEGEIIL